MGRPFLSGCIVFCEKKKRGQAENPDKCGCFEGSCSALRSEAFASAIDSSTNAPHAEWKSMLSGDRGPPQPPTHLQVTHVST